MVLASYIGEKWAIGILGALIGAQQIHYRLKHGEWEKQIND